MIQNVLLVANVVLLVLGGVAAFVCLRGYRRHNSFPMLCLTLGFAFITTGSVIGTVLLYVTTLGFLEIQTIESVLIAFGLAYTVHSMFTRRK